MSYEKIIKKEFADEVWRIDSALQDLLEDFEDNIKGTLTAEEFGDPAELTSNLEAAIIALSTACKAVRKVHFNLK